MTEFVGRTGSHRNYSYPETNRGGSPLVAFARNYAVGSKSTDIGAGIQVIWNSIDAGTDPDEDIPVTPRATGIILVSGILTVTNDSGGDVDVVINVQLDDVSVPVPTMTTTIPDGATVAIPFLAETEAISPLGDQHFIQIFVSGADTELVSSGCVCNVQEVAVATG